MINRVYKMKKALTQTADHHNITRTCGISGNATGITGNIDECELSEEERRHGVYITDLIGMK
jgi:hypothetical protein